MSTTVVGGDEQQNSRDIAPKGLEGVVVAETRVGDVNGRAGFYHYREYSATDLARQRTFEDIWHLLLFERLPSSAAEREEFLRRVAPLRTVPPRTAELLPRVARAGREIDALRSALSLLAAEEEFAPTLEVPIAALREQALRVTAVLPTLIAAVHRVASGREPVAPDPDLPFAANYLWMLHGEVPKPEAARAVEIYLSATIDHGFNASTFTARVITSTGADLASAVIGALAALSGPLHGGAPSRARELLEEIGEPGRAEAVVRAKLAAGERIMGFGHRVYKTRDPRSLLLREVAERIGGAEAELAVAVEDVVVDVLAEVKPGRELYANVEYYAGVVLAAAGVPAELFTSTFAASRTIGWCAHILEQAAANRLIRPSSRYVGPPAPQDVPSLG